MASIRFSATISIDAPTTAVWATATDWEAHSRWVPLTRVSVTHDAGGLGTRFVGRTALGSIGFDDPMTVTYWQPPADAGHSGSCTVTKTGRLLTGTAGFTVTPVGEQRCSLTWFEDVDARPRWLTAPFGRLIAPLASRGLAQTLRKLAADARAVSS